MDEQEYLSTRVDDQLEWYERKAATARRRYKTLRAVEFISAAAVPLVIALGSGTYYRVAAASLGVLAAASTGFQSVNHFQENWVEYRENAEQLKSVRFAFLTRTCPFDTENPLPAFVEAVEGILCGEHSSWGGRMNKTAGPKKLPNYLG